VNVSALNRAASSIVTPPARVVVTRVPAGTPVDPVKDLAPALPDRPQPDLSVIGDRITLAKEAFKATVTFAGGKQITAIFADERHARTWAAARSRTPA